MMEFTEDYRRKQAEEEKTGATARRRRALASADTTEQFSVRFRTREGGVILLAEGAAGAYTVLEVRPEIKPFTAKLKYILPTPHRRNV